MITKNTFIIGALISCTVFASGAFADESASGSTDTGATLYETSTGEVSTGSTSDITTSTGEVSTGVIVGGDRDIHGCIGSAGYSWSGTLNECIRPWEYNSTVSGAVSEIENNRTQILANWATFHEDYGFIKQYLKLPATKAEAKTLVENVKNDLKTYQEAVKTLIKEGQDSIKANTFDPVAFNTKADEVFSTQVGILSKYIDPAKLEDFKRFMDARKALLEVNSILRKTNFELRQDIKEIKKKFLTDSQHEAIAKKLEARTAAFYNKLIERIDAFSIKTNNETLKGQLNELKDMTQAKLDELNK